MSQKKLNFHPGRHGYHFDNTFENHLPLGIVTKGLCGGMVMSALDYWRAGISIPAHTTQDFGTDGVPPEGSKMRDYILKRQVHSLTTGGAASQFVVFPWNDNPDWYHQQATQEQLQKVKQQIDMGRPVMLGLWRMEHDPIGHQVLCYGYDINQNQIRLFLYDPNMHDQEVTLHPVSPEVGCEMRDENGNLYPASDPGEPDNQHFRGYFFMDVYNWGENPPYQPEYNDLVIKTGIGLTPSDSLNEGSSLEGSVVVKNVGDYPARFRSLNFWFLGPDSKEGEETYPFDPLTGPIPLKNIVQPNEERSLGGKVASFSGKPGVYTAGVSLEQNKKGLSKPLAAGMISGTGNPKKFTLHLRPETDVAPAAASLGSKVYVFHKGIDNKIYTNSAALSHPFGVWTEVQGNGKTDQAVAATSLGKRIYVVAKGIDVKGVYINSALEGHGFEIWSEVQPGGFTTKIAPAITSFDNRLYVFARGDDGRIYANSAPDGGPFTGWSALSLSTAPASTVDVPVAAATLGNCLYVFAVFNQGFTNGIYVSTKMAGQPFGGWKEIEGGLSVDGFAPAAAALGSRIYVFVKKDNHIFVNSATAGHSFDGFGHGWTEVQGGGTTDAGLAAASLGNRIHVFAKGMVDKHVYVNSAADGQPFVGWSEVQW